MAKPKQKRKPGDVIGWVCPRCRRFDWADIKEQLAKPEHISYRGVDLGECEGIMQPIYWGLTKEEENQI